jgi:hypothetical protein
MAATALMLAWSLVAGAQDMDDSACEVACADQKSECITYCSRDDNPVECESECEDGYQRCLEACE